MTKKIETRPEESDEELRQEAIANRKKLEELAERIDKLEQAKEKKDTEKEATR